MAICVYKTTIQHLGNTGFGCMTFERFLGLLVVQPSRVNSGAMLWISFIMYQSRQLPMRGFSHIIKLLWWYYVRPIKSKIFYNNLNFMDSKDKLTLCYTYALSYIENIFWWSCHRSMYWKIKPLIDKIL